MVKNTPIIVTILLLICFGSGCIHSETQVQKDSPFQGTVLEPSINNELESKQQLTLLPFYDAGNNKNFISSNSLKVSLNSPYDTIVRHYDATTTATKVISLDGEGAYSITVTTDSPEDAVEVSWLYWYTSKTTDKFGNVEYKTSSSKPPQSRCISNKYFDCKTTLVLRSISQLTPDYMDIMVRGHGSGTIEISKVPMGSN